MASLGKHGIREMAQLNIEKADYAARALQQRASMLLIKRHSSMNSLLNFLNQ